MQISKQIVHVNRLYNQQNINHAKMQEQVIKRKLKRLGFMESCLCMLKRQCTLAYELQMVNNAVHSVTLQRAGFNTCLSRHLFIVLALLPRNLGLQFLALLAKVFLPRAGTALPSFLGCLEN